MNRHGPQDSTDLPRLMAGIAAVCAAGCASALWPSVEHVVGAGLVAAPLAAAAVWAGRREVRIRRRLADTDTASTGTSTSTSTSKLPRAAVTAGRATDTTGALS